MTTSHHRGAYYTTLFRVTGKAFESALKKRQQQRMMKQSIGTGNSGYASPELRHHHLCYRLLSADVRNYR